MPEDYMSEMGPPLSEGGLHSGGGYTIDSDMRRAETEAMYRGAINDQKSYPKQGKPIQMSPKSYYKARPSPGRKQGD